MAQGSPGQNLQSVHAGATREQIEKQLGAPVKQWPTRRGIRYCLYPFDAGRRGSAGDAATFGTLDILSFGLWEALSSLAPPTDLKPGDPGRIRYLAVSFDANDRALRVFVDVTEFTEFPEDGIAP